MPQPFLNCLLQSVPFAKIVHPSRGHQLPDGYRPACQKCVTDGLITVRFPDSHAFDAVAWFPARLWTPFPQAEARFPVVLDHQRRDHSLLTSFTRFEALLPSRIRSRHPELPQATGRCSPGLCPL